MSINVFVLASLSYFTCFSNYKNVLSAFYGNEANISRKVGIIVFNSEAFNSYIIKTMGMSKTIDSIN
jgi:hypothetical protein